MDGAEDVRGREWYAERRVAAARVLLIGAGTLGAETALALAAAGFRRILVADPGIVGEGDGSSLLGEESIGRGRAEAVASALSERFPEGSFTSFGRGAEELDGWNFGIVVGCSGSLPVRLLANRRAKEYGMPYIDGTGSGDRGRMQVVLGEGPCVECGMDHVRVTSGGGVPEKKRKLSAGTARRLAGLMAAEAAEAASGRTDLCTRGIAYCDGDGVSVISMSVDPRCPNHEGERWRQRSSARRTAAR